MAKVKTMDINRILFGYLYLGYLLFSILTAVRSTETFGELKTKVSALQKVYDVFVLGDLFDYIMSGTSW